MGELNIVRLSTLGVDAESDGFAHFQLSAEQVNRVLRLDVIVVGGVDEGKRQHALLLQVGFVLRERNVKIENRYHYAAENLQYGRSFG